MSNSLHILIHTFNLLHILQLIAIPSTEPGVVHFKVDTLQCRVGLNPQHLQSLHIKVTPLPEAKDQWSTEELQVDNQMYGRITVTTR